MTLKEAIQFIQPAIPKEKEVWADIGAGKGIFTLALDQLLLPESSIYALDKNINGLKGLRLQNAQLIVEAFDFNEHHHLPTLDGILMANTLHYSPNPKSVLKQLLKPLRPNGTFIFIEYELNQPRGHWIPYPIPFQKFKAIAQQLPLTPPYEITRIPSVYGNNYMYLAKCLKVGA